MSFLLYCITTQTNIDLIIKKIGSTTKNVSEKSVLCSITTEDVMSKKDTVTSCRKWKGSGQFIIVLYAVKPCHQ